MFYLKIFLSVLTKAFVRGILFFLVTILLVFTLSHKSQLEPYLGKWNSAQEEGAYFFALISNKENIGEIRSKMGMLPGVKSILELSSAQIMEQVRTVLTGMEINPQILNFEYQGVKVNFDPGLKIESQNLIREFLTRLCSEGNLLLGATREVSVEHRDLSWWNKWALNFWSIWFFLYAIWIMIYVSLLSSLRSYAYLIEQYQRRKRVALKSSFIGIFLLVFIAMGISASWWPIDYYYLPFLLSLPLFSLLGSLRKFVWGK